MWHVVVRCVIRGLTGIFEQFLLVDVIRAQELHGVCLVIYDHSFVDQALFFSRHDEIMSLISVVDDVFQIHALGLVKVIEELLIENEGHAGDFLDLTLGLGVPESKF